MLSDTDWSAIQLTLELAGVTTALLLVICVVLDAIVAARDEEWHPGTRILNTLPVVVVGRDDDAHLWRALLSSCA